MATQNLIKNKQAVDTTLDNIIIAKVHDTVTGGRTLDVTGFADTTIQAGHVIMREDATGEYKPLPVDGILPAAHTAVGVLTVSIAAAAPEAAIMVRGNVDPAGLLYPHSAAIRTALSDRIHYLIND